MNCSRLLTFAVEPFALRSEKSDVSINIFRALELLALVGWKSMVSAVVFRPQSSNNGPRESNNSCNKENVMKLQSFVGIGGGSEVFVCRFYNHGRVAQISSEGRAL